MPTAPTAVTALPTPPQRTDPANFPARADAFVAALPTFGTQLNALATNAYNNAVEADADAVAAAASQSAAAASQSSAAASASTATSQASAAAASATAAAGSASTASTQASAASASATAAAGSATTATTQATNASNSATAAAGSATTASTQATNAANSATAAAGSATTATTKASEASASATSAAASAQVAVNAPGSGGTSTTSLSVSTGSKTFVTQTGKAWTLGQFVLISNSAAAANWMLGYITAYNSGTGSMTVEVVNTNGSGTYATWNIALSAPSSDTDQLAQLLIGLQQALDLAGLAARETQAGDVASTPAIEILIRHTQYLADIAGVAARAIAGGDIILRRGTVADPALHFADDLTTGLYSPSAGAIALAILGQAAWTVTSDRRLGIGTATPTGLLDVNDNKVRVRTAQTPASASASGNQGEVAWDSNYVYVCVATNTWKRAAIATW